MTKSIIQASSIEAPDVGELLLWEKVLDEAGSGLVILNDNFRIIETNELIRKWLGDIVGKDFSSVFTFQNKQVLDDSCDYISRNRRNVPCVYQSSINSESLCTISTFPYHTDRFSGTLALVVPIEKNSKEFGLGGEQNQLQILYEVSKACQLSPKLPIVLQSALDAIITTFRVKLGAVYILKEGEDEEKKDFILSAYKGFEDELYNHVKRFSMESVQLRSIEEHFYPIWLKRNKIYFPLLRQKLREHGIDEIICIPLFSKNTLLGLFYLTNSDPLQLGSEHRTFLISLGRQLGVAIDNARLFESISRAKTELEISFDAIQHNIFVIDYNYSIYRVNRATRKKYGRLEKILGKKYYQIIYQQEDPPPRCPVYLCFLTAKPVQEEGTHPRWGGYFEFHAFPVFSTTGELQRVVYYEKDITEEQEMEQRLRQSERLKSLGTLATGIAHEIRNPLAAINLNIQMLDRELELESDQKQMMGDIKKEIRRIDKIVKQVLGFARPGKPATAENSLNEILHYCYKLTRTQLRKKGIQVEILLDDELPVLVLDFDQIAQVVMNLIINALEAMPTGGEMILQTFWEKEKNRIGLMVKDNGTGISSEDQEHIFDPFFTRKPHGSGLGLYISQQIIEKHQATIELSSIPGEGTSFYVYFPVPGEIMI